MALLTIPEVTKGTPATITLDKSVLFALSAVSADAYFSVQSNVSKCIVEYRSSPGKQKRRLVFDLSQATPSASILIPSTGRSSFAISKIILVDFANDTLSIPAAQIPSGLGISIGAGGGASLPVASPSLWLKADAITGVANNGGVTTWTASAGNNATGPEAITYLSQGINNLPVLAFTGTRNGLLRALNSTVAGAHTTFIVGKRTGFNNIDYMNATAYAFDNPIGSGGVFGIKSNNKLSCYMHSPSGGYYDGTGSGVIATGDSFMVSLPFSAPGPWTLYLNGTADGGATATGYKAVQGIDIGGVALSIDPNAGNRYIGYIGEIIVYSGALNQTDRQKVEGYLAHKWGLTAKLPSDHPYKNTPPA